MLVFDVPAATSNGFACRHSRELLRRERDDGRLRGVHRHTCGRLSVGRVPHLTVGVVARDRVCANPGPGIAGRVGHRRNAVRRPGEDARREHQQVPGTRRSRERRRQRLRRSRLRSTSRLDEFADPTVRHLLVRCPTALGPIGATNATTVTRLERTRRVRTRIIRPSVRGATMSPRSTIPCVFRLGVSRGAFVKSKEFVSRERAGFASSSSATTARDSIHNCTPACAHSRTDSQQWPLQPLSRRGQPTKGTRVTE